MKSTQNALPFLQMRTFLNSAWSDAAVTGVMLNRNGSNSHPQEKPLQTPKGMCFLSPAHPPPRGKDYNHVTWEDTGIHVFISRYYGDTYSLALAFLHLSSSITNQAFSFGNPCYNFIADAAERNIPSTWILKILWSANTANDSDKFLVLFKPSSSNPNCNYT